MAVDISNLEMSRDFQEDGQIKLDFLLQRSIRLQTTLKSATAKVQESLKHATESKEPDSEQEDFYFGVCTGGRECMALAPISSQHAIWYL